MLTGNCEKVTTSLYLKYLALGKLSLMLSINYYLYFHLENFANPTRTLIFLFIYNQIPP